MARDVYLYADESGNLDYGGSGKRGATEYFGFGTAVFYDDHGAQFDGGSAPPRGRHRKGN